DSPLITLSVSMFVRPPTSTLFPYTTLFRSYANTQTACPAGRLLSISCMDASICSSVHQSIPGTLLKADRNVPSVRLLRSSMIFKIGRAPSELQSREKLVCRLLLEKENLFTQ